MQCRSCKTINASDAKFCAHCGTAFGRACASCGHTMQEGARFCSQCGTPFAERTSSKPVAPRTEGELKQITVFFADIAGSTQLSNAFSVGNKKQNGVAVGPGRGSAAGSPALYGYVRADASVDDLHLAAPVTDIGVQVHSLVPRSPDSAELFPGGPASALDDPGVAQAPAAQRAQHEALLALLERLSVRLGPGRVQQARRCADHRLSQSQSWVPALSALRAARRPSADDMAAAPGDIPQPSWLLPEPLPLALDAGSGPREQPLYQGPLQLLAGPHRVEAGWWDTRDNAIAEARDHYLASSPRAGLLWVCRTRHAPPDGRSPWFLLGFFA